MKDPKSVSAADSISCYLPYQLLLSGFCYQPSALSSFVIATLVSDMVVHRIWDERYYQLLVYLLVISFYYPPSALSSFVIATLVSDIVDHFSECSFISAPSVSTCYFFLLSFISFE